MEVVLNGELQYYEDRVGIRAQRRVSSDEREISGIMRALGPDIVDNVDDRSLGSTNRGRTGDAAVADVVVHAIDLENPIPFVGFLGLLIVRPGDLTRLLEVNGSPDVGERLITDFDGEKVRVIPGGRRDTVRAVREILVARAEADANAVTEQCAEFGLAVFDCGAVVIEGEDLLSRMTGLGSTERPVLAHADAVTPSASHDRDEGFVGVCRGERTRWYEEAGNDSQECHSSEDFLRHPSPCW